MISMIRAAKFRFYPTLKQRRQLSKEFGQSRYVYNYFLKLKSELYKSEKKNISRFDMSALLTKLKCEFPWLRQSSSTTLGETLEDLDNAFKAFFKKNARYPKQKKRYSKQSVRYNINKRQKNIFLDGRLLKLPKLGNCKLVWTSPVDNMPNTATVSRDTCGDWFISLQFESNIVPYVKETSKEIGLDFGLTSLITTSEGEKIKPPRPYHKARKKLKRRARHLSRAKKKSKNRIKKRLRVARVHRQIANQRKDFLHKTSTSIVSQYCAIAIEDLSVKSMAARQNGQRKLARSIGDAGWRELRTFLEYKSTWYGRELMLIPRFQKSTGVCPGCGHEHKLDLSERSFQCQGCGIIHDRDIAAAQVILGIARSARTAA